MTNVSFLLPRLTINRQFMSDFLTAETPCFALGMVEERNRRCGCMAFRFDEPIPTEISNAGFRFGHALYGTSTFEVLHFAFEFYGFKTYNVLLNPNNPLLRTVLTSMVEIADAFFFELSPGHATAFRTEIGAEILAGIGSHLPHIQRSATTDAEYRLAVDVFEHHPEPPGGLLHWVCRDNPSYLDLTGDPLELMPR